jgi:hypothetical protein
MMSLSGQPGLGSWAGHLDLRVAEPWANCAHHLACEGVRNSATKFSSHRDACQEPGPTSLVLADQWMVDMMHSIVCALRGIE